MKELGDGNDYFLAFDSRTLVDSNDESSVHGIVMLQPNEEHVSTLVLMQDTMIEGITRNWFSQGGDKFNLAILILTSVNIFAAVLTVASIFCDAWSTEEGDFDLPTRYLFS